MEKTKINNYKKENKHHHLRRQISIPKLKLKYSILNDDKNNSNNNLKTPNNYKGNTKLKNTKTQISDQKSDKKEHKHHHHHHLHHNRSSSVFSERPTISIASLEAK